MLTRTRFDGIIGNENVITGCERADDALWLSSLVFESST